MDNKEIAKLAEISYIDSKLDKERVAKIMKHLSRSELREYINALRRIESKITVYIDSNFDLNDQDKKKFLALFSKKNVIFRKDASLMFGIRITEDDMVYNLNMKNTLEQIKGFLNN